MSSLATLPDMPTEHLSLDYERLRQQGIRLLERIAGQQWTDFNAHDPGITILEQLCYALTDLGYRIAHEMPDLLAGPRDPYASLYTPARILTSEPVTLTDLRKLVLDVDGVRNAWIELVDEPDPALYYHLGARELHLHTQDTRARQRRDVVPVALRGLYRVLVATSDVADIDGVTVRRDVIRRLQAHRPLCEDFAEVRVLEPQDIQVHARIELGHDQDGESVLLAIYQALAELMAPSIRFATLGEMLAAGKPVTEIFSGPRLHHGFLDDGQLARMTRPTAVYTSDLIRVIMDVAGVRAVRDIGVAKGDQAQAWVLPLDASRSPRFDPYGSTFTITRDDLAVSMDTGRVIRAYIERARQKARAARVLAREDLDRVPPAGRDRRLGRYLSMQTQLPACYGVGHARLPDSAPIERRARAKQLQAYLLFFDQILANCFAQLDHAKELLSFSATAPHTYAAQGIDDPALGVEALHAGDLDSHRAIVQAITDAPDQALPSRDRRNRFLDHLLARFGEQFTEYSLLVFGALSSDARVPGASDQAAVAAADRLARDKAAFLRDYPRISSGRGSGLDYTVPGGVSGYELRLRRALGIDAAGEEDVRVIEHILLRPIPEDRNQLGPDDTRVVPLLAASPYLDPYSLQLSVVFPAWPARFVRADFKDFVERTVRAETPAHLTPYVHWLDEDAWARFTAVYEEWLIDNRGYRSDAFGM